MHRQFHKRQTQTTDLLAAPSTVGLDGSGVTASGHSTGTELAYNTLSSSTGSSSAPPLQFGGSGITVTVTTPQGTSTSSTPSSSGSKSSTVSVATVVAVCVGAFVAAGLLICLSVMVYRRSSRRPIRSPDTWKQLGNDQERREGKTQTGEKGEPQKSPSSKQQTPGRSTLVRDFSFDSSDDVRSSFSSYHPKLAEELAQPPKAFTNNHGGLPSWDESTVVTTVTHKNDSYSLRSVHIESGTMSPSLNLARITPPSTASGYHRWESAEVILPDDHPTHRQVLVNPFADTQPQVSVRQKTNSNPFFGAQDVNLGRRQSQPRNPFSDHAAIEPIPHISHTQSDSVTSNSDSAYGADRAMQSLINALNLSQGEVEERLRIASMQPSEMSRYSVNTCESLYDRESMAFPSPPQAR